MANSLEFSPGGHPIENRFDGYGEFLADSLPEDSVYTLAAGEWYAMVNGREFGPWPDRGSALAGLETEQNRLTRKIDRKRAAFLASGQPDDFDPFAQVEGEEKT